MEEHCKDCCCAQSWAALGITEYTGKSIPEHISELRQALLNVSQGLSLAYDALEKGYYDEAMLHVGHHLAKASKVVG